MNRQFLNKCLNINHTCPLCDMAPANRYGVCNDCELDLPYLQQGCARCALPGMGGTDGLCSECRDSPPCFDKVLAGFNYRFPLPQLIHRVKTSRDPEPLYWLSYLLAKFIDQRLDPLSTLIPVPMHSWDQTLRGFNQSELISRRLAKLLHLRHQPRLLSKLHRTPHQARLNRTERKANLQNCYELGDDIPNRVTLVDDVMTTGTTVERLSSLLINAGCQKVDVVVLCRTPG